LALLDKADLLVERVGGSQPFSSITRGWSAGQAELNASENQDCRPFQDAIVDAQLIQY
jgi:hypothetical protein